MSDHNKFFLLTMITLAALLAGCRSAPPGSATIDCETSCDSGGPTIVFASTAHDFGKISAGAKKNCVFEFINDGGRDLVIKNIHASCGCTTTTTANTTLKPGQASQIEVTYTAGSSGKSKKRVKVYTNDPAHPETTLWVSADVFGAIQSAKGQRTLLTPAKKQSTTTATSQKKDDMPKALKKQLRNLNKITGG